VKVLVDLNHPAHVHFFRHPMALLRERGCEIVVTSRAKDVAMPLLDAFGIVHRPLSAQSGSGLLSLGRELVQRDAALYRLVRRWRPDVMAAIGGTFVAHVGWASRIPSLVFYDTENAKLQNAITYPLAHRVIVPRCYQGWVPRTHLRYDGYHELSYLHPSRFAPDRAIAERNGLDPRRDNFLIRTVSWQANHDVFETGWDANLLRQLVVWLAPRGKVHISSEAALPEDLATHAYRGQVGEIHHLMAHCRLVIGESATMASEAAVLGVPALYAAATGRGYTDEQEVRYGLVRNLRQLGWDDLRDATESMLSAAPQVYRERRELLLRETIDVAAFVADMIEKASRREI
jgi:uncharacterized protein